jgi:hypothetical protein
MTSRRAVIAALAAALLLGLVWFLWPRHDEDPSASTSSLAPASSIPSKSEKREAKISAPLEVSHLADQLNSPASDIQADLRIVEECLATFRSNFPHDGNPVGSNAEITAALTGQNKIHFAFIPPHHPAIKNGELCDRWGTPFFFHAESGTRMIVRSAGPDKKMWTADDLELSP